MAKGNQLCHWPQTAMSVAWNGIVDIFSEAQVVPDKTPISEVTGSG